MNDSAKQTIAIVKTQDVCARVQPNSFSRGRTKTLHQAIHAARVTPDDLEESLPLFLGHVAV